MFPLPDACIRFWIAFVARLNGQADYRTPSDL